ncbi:hypothetical protein VCRA2123O444_60105 [Vibrio crassostreae]|nr:hypothetical protein VCRA2119O432_100061 [Vibrio crassostreae]CAK1698014.1 hypothetical protein VCRA2114O423_100061 [Vibrio crassostreae]CAK1702626.1 hypothetical protein VCRA2113O413_100106 [Vibrio crassostreae]CAK2159244.1 hypothetical protein VCRA2114O422_60061 [Vibrio crassostreae]CAK2162744.1 hypothetical protein VCRA2119O431_60061 [Vibrio crassostreae]
MTGSIDTENKRVSYRAVSEMKMKLRGATLPISETLSAKSNIRIMKTIAKKTSNIILQTLSRYALS